MDISLSMDENDKYSISEIQHNVLANSEAEIRNLFALTDQKVEILNKTEINPPSQPKEIAKPIAMIPPPSKPIENKPAKDEIKYFTAGGIKFKMAGTEVYQKQWVTATQEEKDSIRIINDKNNKIVSLDGKHIEIEHWIKVEKDDN